MKIPKEFLEKIFWIENQTQLCHWKERNSGFKHEKLGEFYTELLSQLDTLVESVIGVVGQEVVDIDESMYIINSNCSIDELLQKINSILLQWRNDFDEIHALVNLIDDLLSLVVHYMNLLKYN